MATPRRLAGPFLPLEARFLVAGSVWSITTNAPQILAAGQEIFQPAAEDTSVALKVSCYVDSEICEEKPWPQPHFRGLDHLVYAAYAPSSSMLIDLLQRRVVGMFSPEIAEDTAYWKSVVFPVLLGITSVSLGITPLHCACLVKNGRGLILSGNSGSGKSTLALSLSLNEFAYLSDDWTYFSREGAAVCAWGIPLPVKLLPDAVKFFPKLASMNPARSLNGEMAYEVDPVSLFGANRALSCEPQWMVFIEKGHGRAVFEPISSDAAFERFAPELDKLPTCLSAMRAPQLETIRDLVKRQCWVMHHGLSPAQAADELSRFCAV